MLKREIMQKNRFGGVFPNEEVFREIYGECIENQQQASKDVRDSYSRMNDEFENYLNAVQEDMFRYAYQSGYEAAVLAFGKGGAA